MFESFILGAVQGIAEWLPISSEAMVVLIKNNFFPDGSGFSEMISFAIFLHLGTLLSVLVYYRAKIWDLVQSTIQYSSASNGRKRKLRFIFWATAVSGILGIVLLKFVGNNENFFNNPTSINMFVAGFLVLTAILLYIGETKKTEHSQELTTKRSIITGIFQGLAAIPGVSRSGSTVAGMALLGISKERALELSFILSVPIVFLANIVLNFDTITSLTVNHVVALITAFIFGLITIELLLRLVRRVRFSYLVGVFAIILILFSAL